MAIVRIEDVSKFVGLDAQEAEIDIAQHGYEVRVVEADGRTNGYGLRPDYDPLRCNLWVAKGKVTKASIG